MTLGGRFVFQRPSLPICNMGFGQEWVWLLITENLKYQSLKEDTHLFFFISHVRDLGVAICPGPAPWLPGHEDHRGGDPCVRTAQVTEA